jgi:hypothetical protein
MAWPEGEAKFAEATLQDESATPAPEAEEQAVQLREQLAQLEKEADR